jgi:hypothetical protein
MMKKKAHTAVFEKLLEPVGRSLNPEAAEKLLQLRVDAKTQSRIDKLARRCNEGKLTDAEKAEYETWVWAIDFVAILQMKARKLLSHQAGK